MDNNTTSSLFEVSLDNGNTWHSLPFETDSKNVTEGQKILIRDKGNTFRAQGESLSISLVPTKVIG